MGHVRSPLHPALAAAALGWLAACSNGAGGPLDPGALPYLVPRPTALDFGPVPIGTEGTGRLTLANPTAETQTPILLPGSIGPCGAEAGPYCVRQLPGPIAPGGEGELLLAFRPQGPGSSTGVLIFGACAKPGCERAVGLMGQGISSGLRCGPLRLEFGEVGVSRCGTAELRCQGPPGGGVTLTGLRITGGPEIFSVDTTGLGSVAPEEVRAFVFTGCPAGLGPAEGTFVVESDQGELRGELLLNGVDPHLVVTPPSLDLGRVPIGTSTSGRVQLRNLGTSELVFTSIASGGADLVLGPTPTRLDPGAMAELTVTVTPRAMASGGRVTFTSNDPAGPKALEVSVEGVATTPCRTFFAPVEIGPVEIGRRGSADLIIENQGPTPCTFAGIHFTPASNPAFTAEAPGPATIAPAERLFVPIHFEPEGLGTAQGELLVTLLPDELSVPVRGEGTDGFLRVVPDPVAFGPVTEGCSTPTRRVSVRPPHFGSSATLLQVALSPVIGPPFTLSPGLVLPGPIDQPIEIAFTPSGLGEARSELVLTAEVDGRQDVVRIPITATTQAASDRVETRTVPRATQLDVLFVLDHSCSNTDDVARLGDGIADYVALLNALGVDYHLAVTTADVEVTGPAGRLVPLDPPGARVVTANLPNPTQRLRDLFEEENDIASGVEQGLVAAHLATVQPLRRTHNAGWLRRDSLLVLVFLSDEEDQSPSDPATYAELFTALRPIQDPNLLRVVTLVGPVGGACPLAYDGVRYLDLGARLGGAAVSFCAIDASTLSSIPTLRGEWESWDLAGDPSPGTLTVRVDGVALPHSYDPARRRIQFNPLALPLPGAVLEAQYQARCP